MPWTEYLRFFLALIFVLSLMGGLWLALRHFGLNTPAMAPNKKRRLNIVEYLPLDARRRAVLIRRDDTEHLVILGPTGETVVETKILPPTGTDSDD